MLETISDYATTIILLIISITFVELLLPDNKNKKYVMFTCSLIIMLSVINPILSIFNNEIDVSSAMNEIKNEMNEIEYNLSTNYNLNDNIYSAYIENLENNMKKRLEDIGYKVLETKINIDQITYEPKSIEMKVKYEDGYVQPIVIEVFENSSSDTIYEADIKKIKEILYADYGVDKNNIKINGE